MFILGLGLHIGRESAAERLERRNFLGHVRAPFTLDILSENLLVYVIVAATRGVELRGKEL